MIKSLLSLKTSINEVLSDIGIDTLLASELARLEEVASLLEPFANLTDILQTDKQSLSSILPSILDLECHLQLFNSYGTLTSSMLKDLRNRFQTILLPDSDSFNPIPAAACLLDPTLASILLTPEMANMLNATKQYIASASDADASALDANSLDDIAATEESSMMPALKKFKFLATKMRSSIQSSAAGSQAATDTYHNGGHVSINNHLKSDTSCGQLNRYLMDISEMSSDAATDVLAFWKE